MIDLFHIVKQDKVKVNPLVKLINSPEDYILTAQYEGDELVVRIKEKKNE